MGQDWEQGWFSYVLFPLMLFKKKNNKATKTPIKVNQNI